jgi:hypothetical protein
MRNGAPEQVPATRGPRRDLGPTLEDALLDQEAEVGELLQARRQLLADRESQLIVGGSPAIDESPSQQLVEHGVG